MIRTYSELIKLKTFDERFDYLSLDGVVGRDTFAHDRYLNQAFYRSYEWKKFRREIIVRDNGCDLGMEGFEILGRIYVHHLNPITIEDIVNRSDYLLNPEYAISVSLHTHNAIHYSDKKILTTEPMTRKPNDTCPWKQ